jgi:phage portal protein BeeE
MTILGRLFGIDEERSFGPVSIPQWESDGKWQQGMVWTAYPGTTVTADSAMRLSAVFACLRLLSEAIATLPLDTFMRQAGTRQPYRPRPDYLSFQPPRARDRLPVAGHAVVPDRRQRFRRHPARRLGYPST